MVVIKEENEVYIQMTKGSDAGKWNPYTMSQCPDSAVGYGLEFRKGRKLHMIRSAKERRRKTKPFKMQTLCSCAANCNCKCVKCICKQQRTAASANAEIIRARRKQGRRKRERPNESASRLVNQLTELVRAHRRRASSKKKKENEPTSTGEANAPKPAEKQSGGEKTTAGPVSNQKKSQANDTDPTHINPPVKVTRLHDIRGYSRKRKLHLLYPPRIVHDAVKLKGVRNQVKKRRLQQPNASTSSGSADSALAKIRRLRRQAKEKNYKPKPPKKRPQ